MTDQEKMAQKICSLIQSDLRIVAATQKVKKDEDKALEAWAEIVKRRLDGASVKDTRREMLPLETELFNLKLFTFKLMKEAFEENKVSCGLPKDADFFDYFMHPFHDKELMRMIENLVKIYETVESYKLKFKELARKMKSVGLEYADFNGTRLVLSDKPQDIDLLVEEEKLRMGLAAQFAAIERIKISIELSFLGCKDIGKWFLDLIETLPSTKITKDLIVYFNLFGKYSENVSG